MNKNNLQNSQLRNKYPEKLRFVDKKTWSTAPVRRDDVGIQIQGRYVMEKWQETYMKEFAKTIYEAVSNKGDWLEVGFGLGLFANAIEESPFNESIKGHYIIEPNNEIYKDAVSLAKKCSSTDHKVIPVQGLWQDVIENKTIFTEGSFEAIFFDGSPFDMKELTERQFDFGKHAIRLLKSGGIYSYCNLTGFGKLRAEYGDWESFFRETQYNKLKELGFIDIAMRLVSVTPPQDSEKYRFKEAPILLARKP